MIINTQTRNLKNLFKILTLINLFICVDSFSQTSYVTNGSSTDWGTATAWTPNGVPDIDNWPYDDVTINHDITWSGSNLNAQSNVSTKDMITVNSGATFTVSGGYNLTLSTGDIEVNAGGAVVVTGTLNMSSNGELNIDATGSLTANVVASTGNPSAISNSGDISVTTTWTQGANASVTSSGSIDIGGTLTLSDATGSFNNTGPITIGGNLSVTGSAFSSTDTMTLTGNATLVSGANVDLNGYNTIGGTLSASGSGTDFDLNGGSLDVTGNVTFDGDGNTTIAGDMDAGADVSITGSGGASISLSGTMDVTSGTLTVDNNGFINGTGTIGWGTLSANPNCSDAIITCSGTATSVDNKTDGGCGGTYSDPAGSPLDLNTCAVGSLPIELLSFIVVPNGDQIEVFWVTGMELNNDYFEILGSKNGIDWEVLKVIPGAGNSNIEIKYQETVQSGLNFFKLRQTDYDGTYADSKIIAISKQTTNTPLVYNTPEFIIIQGAKDYSCDVFDIKGSLIHRSELNDDFILIDSKQLAKGIYFVRLNHEGYKILVK